MKSQLEPLIKFPEKVSVWEGAEAIERFNRFLQGRYKWLVSGIDWRYGDYVQRIHKHFDFGPLMCEMVENNKELFSSHLSVYFTDGTFDRVLRSDREAIFANIQILEEWDKHYITEFWVFDEETGTIIEAYHEGYVTLSRPHDVSKELPPPKGLENFVRTVEDEQENLHNISSNKEIK